MLLRGLLEVALVHTLPDSTVGFDSVLVHDDPFALVLPTGHRLLNEPPTALALGEENWIALDSARSPKFRARLIAACGAYGFLPNIRHEAPDLLSVLGLRRSGAWSRVPSICNSTYRPKWGGLCRDTELRTHRTIAFALVSFGRIEAG